MLGFTARHHDRNMFFLHWRLPPAYSEGKCQMAISYEMNGTLLSFRLEDLLFGHPILDKK